MPGPLENPCRTTRRIVEWPCGNMPSLSHKVRMTRKVGFISTIMSTTLTVTCWHKIRDTDDGRRGISICSPTEQVCFLMPNVGGLVSCEKKFQHHKALSLACSFKRKNVTSQGQKLYSTMTHKHVYGTCPVNRALHLSELWDHLEPGGMGQVTLLFTMEIKNNAGTYKTYFSLSFELFQ